MLREILYICMQLNIRHKIAMSCAMLLVINVSHSFKNKKLFKEA